MPNLNKVMLMGNLTRDVELRYTPSNTPVANIGLAINRRWKNQAGEQQEETTFVDCDAWGRTAEVMAQYLKKGRPVYIEGRLRLDQWDDKDGQKRSKLKVVVESFQFLESGNRDDGGGNSASSRGASAPARKPAGSFVEQLQGGGGHAELDESDIPFVADVPRDF